MYSNSTSQSALEVNLKIHKKRNDNSTNNNFERGSNGFTILEKKNYIWFMISTNKSYNTSDSFASE